MNLSAQDIRDILRILEQGPYDELRLETGHFFLHLTRNDAGPGWQQELEVRRETQADSTDSLPSDSQADTEPAPGEPGLQDIRAPLPGTFYRAPKPGATPFVEPGSQLETDTVIAIIEVMKLMSAVPAGVTGEVVEILVEDATPVSRGQLLMRVRP